MSEDMRELDAEVAERVMGLHVVPEWLPTYYADGEALVDAGIEVEFHMGPAYIETYGREWPRPDDSDSFYAEFPDALAEAQAEWDADMERFGVPRHCLMPVPEYSSSWDAMRLVVERMRELGWEVCMWSLADTGQMAAGFSFVEAGRYEPRRADSLPEAVCLSALATVEPEP